MTQKFITICFVAILTFISFGMSAFGSENTVLFEELYEADGVFYKKFTSEPFNGIAKFYYNKLYFDDGKERLNANEYFQNGRVIMKEEFCKNGRLKYKRKLKGNLLAFEDGKYINYHCNGNIEYQWTILNGEKEGEFLSYDEDGKLLRKTPYKKGKINGVVEHYYGDGTLANTKTYVNNKLNGVTSLFYPNGNIEIETNYLNDKKDGEVLSYSEEGYLKKKEQFKEGRKDGISFIYWKKEGPTEEHLFKNGFSLKPFTPLSYIESFPICYVQSSKGQFCKSLSKEDRQTYSFNKLKKRVFKPTVDWPNSVALESKDWRYLFKIVPIEGVEKQTFVNKKTLEQYDGIVGNKVKLQFTDEALKATYYTVVTYDLEFNEDKKNWFVVGSVVDDIRGSEDDRKVIGQYRKYDPPIPFLEMRPN